MPDDLEEKLRRWYLRPEIQAKQWAPNLFWRRQAGPDPYGGLKVDPWELEVLFAAILGEKAEHYDDLNRRQGTNDRYLMQNRADFIAISIGRHELPYLTPYADVPPPPDDGGQ